MVPKDVTYLNILVNREDFVSGIASIISEIKPEWSLDKIKYKVSFI